MHAATERRTDVTLPAPEGWDLDGGYTDTRRLPNGMRVTRRVGCPLARARLIRATITLPAEPGPDGEIVTRKARVWKLDTHPTLRSLPAELRVAAADYAAAVERIGSTGGQNYEGGSGGSGTPSGPSAAAWSALETARKVETALRGESYTVSFGAVGPWRQCRSVAIPFLDVLRWVAVDGLDRVAICKRLGGGGTSGPNVSEIAQVITAAAAYAAVALGYVNKVHAERVDPRK